MRKNKLLKVLRTSTYLSLIAGGLTLASCEGDVDDPITPPNPTVESTPNPSPTPEPNPLVKYILTFENNGHGNALDALTDITSIPDILPTLEDENYDFLGWYLDTDFVNEAVPGTNISENITLYAKWQKKNTVPVEEYVKLVVNGAVLNVLKGTEFKAENYVSWQPEHFDCWTFENGTKIEDGYILNSDTKIIAHLVGKCQFNLMFNDELISSVQDYYDSKVKAQIPRYNGNYFFKNICESDFTEYKIIEEESDDNTVVVEITLPKSDTQSLNLNYERYKYDIMFNKGNDKLCELDSITIASYRNENSTDEKTVNDYLTFANSVAQNNQNMSYKEKFDGWYLDSNFEVEATLENILASTDDLTLYGKYSLREKDGTIHFKTNINVQIEDYHYYMEHFDNKEFIDFLSQYSLELDDYDFEGWYDEELDNYIDSNNYSDYFNYADDTTIYAKFAPCEYNLTIYNKILNSNSEVLKLEKAFENTYKVTDDLLADITYGKTVRIEEILPRLKYEFEGYYLDENFETPVSDTLTIKNTQNVTIYAKYIYSIGVMINTEETERVVPEYYASNIYSGVDIYQMAYKVNDDIDFNTKVNINYTLNDKIYDALGYIDYINEKKYVVFDLSVDDTLNGVYVNYISFPEIEDVDGEALKFEINKTLDGFDFTGFEYKDIIISSKNYDKIKSTTYYKSKLINAKDFRESLVSPNVNNYGDILTEFTAENILEASIYQYDDITIASQALFDSSIFGRNTLLKGDYNLNGLTLEFDFDGTSSVMMFDGLMGSINNGTFTTKGKRSLGTTLKNDNEDSRVYLYNSALVNTMFASSSVNDLVINAPNMGFDFTDGYISYQNFIVGYAGADTTFNNTEFNEGYSFLLDENYKALRQAYYNVTNQFGTFYTYSGSTAVYKEALVKYGEIDYTTFWNDYQLNLSPDNSTERQITGIKIYLTNYTTSDYIKNNTGIIEVANNIGDYYLENEEYKTNQPSNTIHDDGYCDNYMISASKASWYGYDKYNYGYLAPRLDFFAKYSVTTNGYFAEKGYHFETIEGSDYKKQVANSELVLNSIELNAYDSSFDYGSAREGYERLTTYGYAKAQDEYTETVKIYNAYQYSYNGTNKDKNIYKSE